MWMDLLLILAAVFPLILERGRVPQRTGAVPFELPHRLPILPVRPEAAPASRPRQ